jgi:hypothetical protein
VTSAAVALYGDDVHRAALEPPSWSDLTDSSGGDMSTCKRTIVGSLAAVGVAIAVTTMPALRLHAAAAKPTVSPAYNLWDPVTQIGQSRLVRSADGISATFQTSGLVPGAAITLWFGVINNPQACASSPCTLDDTANPDVQADFLYGGGTIVGSSGKATVAGRLAAGDPSGSAFIEFGGEGIGLLDPQQAEVLLLLHSHGPAQSGQLLKAQISSFLGGCEVFLGPNGFASGPGDIPDEVGECSTFRISMHH